MQLIVSIALNIVTQYDSQQQFQIFILTVLANDDELAGRQSAAVVGIAAQWTTVVQPKTVSEQVQQSSASSFQPQSWTNAQQQQQQHSSRFKPQAWANAQQQSDPRASPFRPVDSAAEVGPDDPNWNPGHFHLDPPYPSSKPPAAPKTPSQSPWTAWKVPETKSASTDSRFKLTWLTTTALTARTPSTSNFMWPERVQVHMTDGICAGSVGTSAGSKHLQLYVAFTTSHEHKFMWLEAAATATKTPSTSNFLRPPQPAVSMPEFKFTRPTSTSVPQSTANTSTPANNGFKFTWPPAKATNIVEPSAQPSSSSNGYKLAWPSTTSQAQPMTNSALPVNSPQQLQWPSANTTTAQVEAPAATAPTPLVSVAPQPQLMIAQ